MSAAVPTCRSVVFVCVKIMFHKLMEKSQHQDRRQICVPSVHLRVTTEDLLITQCHEV